MYISAGRLLFAHRYPRGRRANSGVFSIPESAGAGTGAQNRAECPGPGPPMPQELVIFYRTRPMVPAFLPKSSMQAPSAAEYSQKCTPHPTPGTRSKKTNSLDLPGASDESSFGRGYSSPKLMPSALASRTRSLWGSTYLSLPATSSSGMWHILPSRRAIM